jgi:enoyl-CoA hydratase
MGLISKVARAPSSKPKRSATPASQRAGPLAVQAVKRSVVEGLALPPEQALEREMELGIPVSMSEDCREGTKAFKEKRKPVFKGR